MKTASTLIQILALSACFTIYLSGTGGVQMTGVRRALQTMTVSASLPSTQDASSVLPADVC
jgi:hypothetical protein